MTTEASTTHRARGVLAEKTPDSIVFTSQDSDYRLHLTTLNEVPTTVGDRIVGTIRLHAAKRFDVVNTGGRYIEPLYGRPRRIQGDVVAIDTSNNTITVNAAFPIVVTVSAPQSAADFQVGQFVAGDVRAGASFSVAGA